MSSSEMNSPEIASAVSEWRTPRMVRIAVGVITEAGSNTGPVESGTYKVTS